MPWPGEAMAGGGIIFCADMFNSCYQETESLPFIGEHSPLRRLVEYV